MPLPSAAPRNPVGAHVKVGSGLVSGALACADQIGAECIQVFVGNPRGWAASAGDPRVDAAFRSACQEAGRRVFVHTPYLVNVGSPNPATYERSVAAIAHNLRRAAALGAEGVVVHTGSCVAEGGVETAMAQVRAGLLPVLDALDGVDGVDGVGVDGVDGVDGQPPALLLEPTAGQGRSLCATVEDLAPYLAALDHHPKVGICLDTCHLFAAGAPLDEPGGATATLDRLLEVAGPGRLRLVHANDSKDARGSRRDRHERIGEGPLGLGAFEELFAHPGTAGVPFLLETPGSWDVGDPQVGLLKKLRDA